MSKEINHFDAVFSCPFGGIGIQIEKGKVKTLEFLYQKIQKEHFTSIESKKIAKDILRYFENSRHHFNSKTSIQGTAFQKRVWQQLLAIPAGEVRTYGEIAEKLKSSPRAVGNACRKNPVPLIVPCHRVVAKNGLGGFAGKRQGQTVELKQWLLDHEIH